MACRQPSNMRVPGMQGSLWKWPAKYQSSGAMGASARR